MTCPFRRSAGDTANLDQSALYDRTARNAYVPYRLAKRRRRWDSVSWWLSSILAVALVAWALTWWFSIRGDDGNAASVGRVITFEVTSAENGQPLASAQVSFPGGSVPTDASGTVSLAFPDEPVDLEIAATGYEPVYGTAGYDVDQLQRIALNPASRVVNSRPVDGSADRGDGSDGCRAIDGSRYRRPQRPPSRLLLLRRRSPQR